jgi:hypothetical protein
VCVRKLFLDLSLDGVCQSDKGSEHTPGITIERRLQNTHTNTQNKHTHRHTHKNKHTLTKTHANQHSQNKKNNLKEKMHLHTH